MHILASKFIYFKDRENLSEILNPFENLGVQLSFFQKQEFFKIDHKVLKKTYAELNIEIPTVHAPTVDIFDKEFLEVLELLKKIYEVRLVSIHPQKGESGPCLSKLEKYAKDITDLDVILALRY